MITAVLDANVLISGITGFGNKKSITGNILHYWQDQIFTLITSESILQEVRLTLRKPYFVSHVPPHLSARLQAALRYQTQLTQLTITVAGVATHPEDDLVLAAAVSAKANYLVTGDQKLLKLDKYEDTYIQDPVTFFSVLAVKAYRSGK